MFSQHGEEIVSVEEGYTLLPFDILFRSSRVVCQPSQTKNGEAVNRYDDTFYCLLLHCRSILSQRNVFGEDIWTHSSKFYSDSFVENTILSQTTSAPCVCVCVPCRLLVGQISVKFQLKYSSNYQFLLIADTIRRNYINFYTSYTLFHENLLKNGLRRQYFSSKTADQFIVWFAFPPWPLPPWLRFQHVYFRGCNKLAIFE